MSRLPLSNALAIADDMLSIHVFTVLRQAWYNWSHYHQMRQYTYLIFSQWRAAVYYYLLADSPVVSEYSDWSGSVPDQLDYDAWEPFYDPEPDEE